MNAYDSHLQCPNTCYCSFCEVLSHFSSVGGLLLFLFMSVAIDGVCLGIRSNLNHTEMACGTGTLLNNSEVDQNSMAKTIQEFLYLCLSQVWQGIFRLRSQESVQFYWQNRRVPSRPHTTFCFRFGSVWSSSFNLLTELQSNAPNSCTKLEEWIDFRCLL